VARRIAILGAGFAGICAAIKLRAAGFDDDELAMLQALAPR